MWCVRALSPVGSAAPCLPTSARRAEVAARGKAESAGDGDSTPHSIPAPSPCQFSIGAPVESDRCVPSAAAVAFRSLQSPHPEGPMSNSPLAGKPAAAGLLIDPARLQREYHERQPDVDDIDQLVSFGTSGHRGSPVKGTFTESHILAIAQAICDYRRGRGTDGPVFMGKDTHCLSGPAQRTALEVLAANGVQTVIQRDDGVTPTPVISRAILVHNRGGTDH